MSHQGLHGFGQVSDSLLFKMHDRNAILGSKATVSLSQMSWECLAFPLGSFQLNVWFKYFVAPRGLVFSKDVQTGGVPTSGAHVCIVGMSCCRGGAEG